MSTYTTSLGLEEITPGDQAGLWGNTTNNNLELIDQAVTGVTPISFAALSGTVRTLDAANGALDEARAAVLNITGNATGSNTVVVPNKQKTYLVRNNTGQGVIFRTASPSATYTVEAGNSILVFCDGNNNVFTGIISPTAGTLPVSGGGTNATTFTAGFVISPGGTGTLTTQASVGVGGTATTQISGEVQVPNGGTGLSNVPIGSLLVGNGVLDMTVLAQGTNGQVLTSNGAGANPSFRDAATGVASVSSGGNITVSPTTGAVVVTLSGANVISALGYTPGTGNGNVSTGTTNNFTGANNYSSASSIAMTASSNGDQRIGVAYTGFSSGLAPAAVQCGAGGFGLTYTPGRPSLDILGGSLSAYFSGSSGIQGNNSATWTTVSDQNLKTNLRPISSALDKLNALNPCHFEYKDKLGETQTGFIAQEFEIVFPGHVTEMGVADNYREFVPEGQETVKTLDPNLVPYLVKAIQELSAKVDAQAAEIAALKAK
jgi:hypothetical protein